MLSLKKKITTLKNFQYSNIDQMYKQSIWSELQLAVHPSKWNKQKPAITELSTNLRVKRDEFTGTQCDLLYCN